MSELLLPLAAFVLLWLRLLPACVLLPSAAGRRLVLVGPLALSALLAAVLVPLFGGAEPVLLSPANALRELFLGMGFAAVVAAPLLALAWFGHALDRVVTGPGSGAAPVLARLYGALGLALLFALGGHRVLLEAFADLTRALPVGQVSSALLAAAVPIAITGLAQALLWALLWAAPFVVSLWLVDLLAALVSRVFERAPRVLPVGPLRALCALTVLVLGGAFVAELFPDALAWAGQTAGGLAPR